MISASVLPNCNNTLTIPLCSPISIPLRSPISIPSIYSVDLSGSFHNKDFDGSARAAKLGREVDLIHLRLIYLSEDFNIQKEQSNLIKYLQSVFANKVGEASCNPYHPNQGCYCFFLNYCFIELAKNFYTDLILIYFYLVIKISN